MPWVLSALCVFVGYAKNAKLCLLPLGCISGLCLQRSALKDEVCPLRTEGRFPPAQCFLAVTQAHSGGPLFPVGLEQQEAVLQTTGFCCLLHHEVNVYASKPGLWGLRPAPPNP